MKLNEKQKATLSDKLKTLSLKCSLCGGMHFTVIDSIFEMREFQGGDLIIGGEASTLPLVILVCDTCGGLKTLSAVKLGILDTEEKQVKDDGQGE